MVVVLLVTEVAGQRSSSLRVLIIVEEWLGRLPGGVQSW